MSYWMQILCYATAFACVLFAASLLQARPANPTPSRLLAAFFLVYAIQAALLGVLLAEGRPHPAAIIRPSLAMTIGPLLFLYFASTANPAFRLRPAHALHLIPALIIASELTANIYVLDIDFAIIASFGVYAVLLSLKARRSAAQFAHLGPSAPTVFRWMIASAALLALSFAGEIAIAADIARTGAMERSSALFLFQLVGLATSGAVIMAALQRPSPLEWVYSFGAISGRAPALSDEECNKAIRAFEKLSEQEKYYTENDASLAEAAQRLDLPARRLSEAINRAYGESYSRRMNRLRVAEAKRLIDSGPDLSMTQVMFDSGFRTKSSFNREFRAIEGVSPTDYRTASLEKRDQARPPAAD